MKFWKENKLDQEYELSDEDLLNKFREWCKTKEKEWLGYRGVWGTFSCFIGSKDGLNSVNDEKEFHKFVKANWEEMGKIVYGTGQNIDEKNN